MSDEDTTKNKMCHSVNELLYYYKTVGGFEIKWLDNKNKFSDFSLLMTYSKQLITTEYMLGIYHIYSNIQIIIHK